MKAALVISARDNVATVLEPSRLVTFATGSVAVIDSIPRGGAIVLGEIAEIMADGFVPNSRERLLLALRE